MKKAAARWDSRLSIGRGPRGVPASIPLSKLSFAPGTVKQPAIFVTLLKWGNSWHLRPEERQGRNTPEYAFLQKSSQNRS